VKEYVINHQIEGISQSSLKSVHRESDSQHLVSASLNLWSNCFPLDRISKTGNAALTPSAPVADLDNVRSQENLNELSTLTPQALAGMKVKVTDFEPRTVAPQTETSGNFISHSNTDNFAAMSAYYQLERLYQKFASLGYDLTTYLTRIALPLEV